MSDYGFTHEGKVYTPNATPDVPLADNDARNRAIQAAELEYWKAQPDRMVGYFNFPAENNRPNKVYRETFYPLLTGAKVSTWLGADLGSITAAHVYRHNLGHRFVSLTVRGTNGATYYGRASFDWGQCVRLRKAKHAR